MAASTDLAPSPDTGYFEWERPEGVVRFAEFSLTLASPLRQIELKYENPLCRLAGRTSLGAQACGRGCGLCSAPQPASHVCPLGMLMIQAPSAPGGGSSRWVGRRFPDIDSLHAALDALLAEGIDEETILASLPPNPVVSIEELREAAESRREGAQVIRSIGGAGAPPVIHETNTVCVEEITDEPSGPDVRDLVEYLEQVHRLIAGAERPETVCERFLRAVAAVVPFEEMAIYLRGRSDADWVIAATIDAAGSRGASRSSSCHLDPQDMGVASLEQRQVLIQRPDGVTPFTGELEGPATLALPFPLAGGELSGVWLARQGADPRPCALGSDVVRYMRLLSEFLASRLLQIEELKAARLLPVSAADSEPVHCASEPVMALADALCREVARGARHDHHFTLLCLQVAGPLESVPVAELTNEFSAVLRPYDTLVNDPESPSTWFAVLPYAQESAARMVAARLMTVFEDLMDARGGMEELGLRLAVGGSIWGSDAATAEQMILNASGAASTAQTAAESIRFQSADCGLRMAE